MSPKKNSYCEALIFPGTCEYAHTRLRPFSCGKRVVERLPQTENVGLEPILCEDVRPANTLTQVLSKWYPTFPKPGSTENIYSF